MEKEKLRAFQEQLHQDIIMTCRNRMQSRQVLSTSSALPLQRLDPIAGKD